MHKIREIIAGKKCVIYADEQPQVTPHLRLARAFAWCVNSLTK